MSETKLSIQNKKFALNSAIYLAAELLNKLIPFIMLPILLRYLTQSEYGSLSVILNVIEFTTICVLLGGNAYLRVEFFKKSYPLTLVLSSVLAHSVSVALILLILLVFGWAFFLPDLVFGIDKLWLIFIVLIALGNSIIATFVSYFQCEEKPVRVGGLNVFINIIGFSITVFLLEQGYSADARIIAILLSVLFVSLVLIYRFRRMLVSEWQQDCSVDALKFGIGSLPHGLSWWLRAGADNLILVSIISTAAVGEYAVSMQLAMVLLVVSNALNQAVMPRMFQGLKDNKNRETKKLICSLMLLVSGVFLIMILFAPYVLTVIVPDVYHYEITVFYSLATAVLLRAGCVFTGNYFYYYKKVKSLSSITISSAMLHVPLCYILVVNFGVIGVGFAGIVSYGMTLLFQLIVLNRVKNNERVS
jgi:O-antigen/teichoic acid export membrane protein